MNNTLQIKTGQSIKQVFLQNGFYNHNLEFSPLHNHNYAEIHAVVKGKINFFVENREYTADAGSIFIIPSKAFHWVMAENKNSVRIAFQFNHTTAKFNLKHISPETLASLAEEINKAHATNNYRNVVPYLSLICCKLTEEETEPATPITDYAFLIYEFFSSRYNEDVLLSDLAKELRLSERQTQRLVKKHTGKTFGQMMTEKRLSMAKTLLENSNFSKSEISEKVGFHSYGGFWKALKKHSDK